MKDERGFWISATTMAEVADYVTEIDVAEELMIWFAF